MTSREMMCLDYLLPDELLVAAGRHALRLREDNAPLSVDRDAPSYLFRASLAVRANARWPLGTTLRVRFLEGESWQKDAVTSNAREWSDYASIGFEFGSEDPQAEIRIKFQQGNGSWSFVGTDSSVDLSRHSMNLGWIDREHSDDEIRGVILHEFGHALSAGHEHQSPAAGIKWDKSKVYEVYAQDPNHWDHQKVDEQIFQKYNRNEYLFTAFDPSSIMLYPIDPDLTLDHYRVDPNYGLSDTDKAFMRRIYPETLETSELKVRQPFEGTIGEPLEENHFAFTIDEPGTYLIETSGPTNMRMALYGPDSRSRLVASDDDSGRDGYNARIETPLMRGAYFLRVQHQGGPRGVYTAILSPAS